MSRVPVAVVMWWKLSAVEVVVLVVGIVTLVAVGSLLGDQC